jgi:hypothetical protein
MIRKSIGIHHYIWVADRLEPLMRRIIFDNIKGISSCDMFVSHSTDFLNSHFYDDISFSAWIRMFLENLTKFLRLFSHLFFFILVILLSV